MQCSLVALYQALLCLCVLAEIGFGTKNLISKSCVCCLIVSISANIASFVYTFVSREGEGQFIFLECLVPDDVRLVAIQQVAEHTVCHILGINLGGVRLMRTEFVHEVAVGACNIVRVTGKGIGVTLAGINVYHTRKSTVGKRRLRS